MWNNLRLPVKVAKKLLLHFAICEMHIILMLVMVDWQVKQYKHPALAVSHAE